MAMQRALGSVLLLLGVCVLEVAASCGCQPASRPTCDVTANSHVVLAHVTARYVTHDRIDYGVTIKATFKGDLLELSAVTITSLSDDCALASLQGGYHYVLTVHEYNGMLIGSMCGYNRLWALVPPSVRSDLQGGALQQCSGDDAVVLISRRNTHSELTPEEELSRLEEIPPDVEEASPYDNVDYDVIEEPITEEEIVDAPEVTPEDTEDTETSEAEPTEVVESVADGVACKNGEEDVPEGWSGRGGEDGNECNICQCSNGLLSCTKKQCHERSS